MLVLNYIGLAIGLAISAGMFGLAVKLLKSDRIEGKKSAARADSVKDAVMGRARTRDDWMPDGRIKGGMIYNRRARRIEVSGRLSNDTLDRVFR